VLATAGTLAIHLLLAVAGDAIVVLNPPRTYTPPPVVELFDIEPPEILKPPPPPVEAAKPEEPEPEPEPTKPVEPVKPAKRAPHRVSRTRSEPPPETPPPANTPAPEGGAPVAHMEGIAPS